MFPMLSSQDFSMSCPAYSVYLSYPIEDFSVLYLLENMSVRVMFHWKLLSYSQDWENPACCSCARDIPCAALTKHLPWCVPLTMLFLSSTFQVFCCPVLLETFLSSPTCSFFHVLSHRRLSCPIPLFFLSPPSEDFLAPHNTFPVLSHWRHSCPVPLVSPLMSSPVVLTIMVELVLKPILCLSCPVSLQTPVLAHSNLFLP